MLGITVNTNSMPEEISGKAVNIHIIAKEIFKNAAQDRCFGQILGVADRHSIWEDWRMK